jgi:superfamily I DNA/RNA helicase
MNRLGPDTMKQEQVIDAIENWRQDKLMVQSTTANDTADCMRVFACFGKTLSEATGYAEFMFQQRGALTLTTGHKAKGLEWDKVYHLDPHLIRVDKEEQEKNLSYVITTRSMNGLYEIESKDVVS